MSHNAPVFTVVLPWVRMGHTEDFVRETLENSGLGKISNAKWLAKQGAPSEGFYEVTIDFQTFPNEELKRFLENGGVIKIFFNHKNFWKIGAAVCPPRQDTIEQILIPHLEFPLRVHSVYTNPK